MLLTVITCFSEPEPSKEHATRIIRRIRSLLHPEPALPSSFDILVTATHLPKMNKTGNKIDNKTVNKIDNKTVNQIDNNTVNKIDNKRVNYSDSTHYHIDLVVTNERKANLTSEEVFELFSEYFMSFMNENRLDFDILSSAKNVSWSLREYHQQLQETKREKNITFEEKMTQIFVWPRRNRF